MLADPTETTVVERELARTYNSTPAYDDPADVLDDYERVMDYVAHHPEEGDHAVSTSLGLPRSRISTWMDGGKPSAVHGIDDATDRGWLADSWTDEMRALNELAAWLLASGSLNQNYTPLFFGEQHRDRLEAIVDAAGLDLRETDRGDKPAQYAPRVGASVLGRLLYTWTWIKGDKSKYETLFPRYPRYAPIDIAEAFVATYLLHRGHVRRDRPNPRIQVMATRSEWFRRDLVALLERVADDPDDVRGDSWPVYVVGDSAQRILDELG